MKILLTNDDGIDAPGIAALAEAVHALGELVVVAPDRHLSGCSHQTTTHRPLSVVERGPGRYAVDGTPADCVRLALLHLAPDVDLILSGVNDGGNLGVDVWHSGTVAAAREAVIFGRPAMALSQYRRRGSSLEHARIVAWTAHIVEQLLEKPLAPGEFWNVNFPDPLASEGVPEIAFCELEHRPLSISYECRDGQWHYTGVYQDRGRGENTDVFHCFAGRTTVTPIRLSSAYPQS